ADCRAIQVAPGHSPASLRRHPGVHRAALPLPAQRLSQRAAVQQRGAEPELLPPAGDGSGSRAGYPAGPALLCRALSGGAGCSVRQQTRQYPYPDATRPGSGALRPAALDPTLTEQTWPSSNSTPRATFPPPAFSAGSPAPSTT